MTIRNIGKKRFGEGGQMNQGGMFSPLMFETMKPIVQEAYNVKDYVKEAKDSEQNQLKAFAEMKASQALMTDQDKARQLHQGYTDAFDQASTQLNNPFNLSRFAQKQAIDYVNNPLRRNIEESSKNLETSKEIASKTPDVDAYGTNGAINKSLWLHEKNGGTGLDKNSVLGIIPPQKNEDLRESIQSAESLAHNLIKSSWSDLGESNQAFLTGMGISSSGWNASNLDKTPAIAELVLKNNTNYKNSVYNREFQNQFDQYKMANPQASDAEAREFAGNNYEKFAKAKVKATTDNMVKTLSIVDKGNKLEPFALPTQASGGNPVIDLTPTLAETTADVEVAKNEKALAIGNMAKRFTENPETQGVVGKMLENLITSNDPELSLAFLRGDKVAIGKNVGYLDRLKTTGQDFVNMFTGKDENSVEEAARLVRGRLKAILPPNFDKKSEKEQGLLLTNTLLNFEDLAGANNKSLVLGNLTDKAGKELNEHLTANGERARALGQNFSQTSVITPKEMVTSKDVVLQHDESGNFQAFIKVKKNEDATPHFIKAPSTFQPHKDSFSGRLDSQYKDILQNGLKDTNNHVDLLGGYNVTFVNGKDGRMTGQLKLGNDVLGENLSLTDILYLAYKHDLFASSKLQNDALTDIQTK